MVGASDEQLDVFNEVWYSILLNTGRFSKGICITVRFYLFIWYDILLDFFYHELSFLFLKSMWCLQGTAIEVIEKQIKKREGAPFLWQLLV